MAKSVKANYLFNLINSASQLLFPLITFPYASRIMMADGIGQVNFFQSIISYISLFTCLGIPMYAMREVAKVRDNGKKMTQIAVEILLLHAFLSLLGYVVVAIVCMIVPQVQTNVPLFLILSVTIFFTAIGCEWFYQGIEDFKYVAVRGLIVKSVSIVLLFLLVKTKEDILWYGIYTVLGTLGGNVFNFIRLRKYLYRNVVHFSTLHPFRHLKPALQIFVFNVIVSIYLQLNNVLLGFMKDAESIEKLRIQLEDAESHLSHVDKELEGLLEEKNLLSTEIKRGKQQKEDAMTELKLLQSTRPGFFIYWFNKTVRTQYKKALTATLTKYNQLSEEITKQKTSLQALDLRVEKQRKIQEQSQKDYDRINSDYARLSELTEAARQELKGAYADASFWKQIESKEVQEISPWYSKRLKQLQSELFIEAMKVNELFILRANATSSRIKTTLDVFFNFLKTGGNLTEREIQAIWNTFWLIVPVVSSTFASIQRMFSQMKTGTIPWLFVDEAGQAVPQAAAGAIWRSKRAVIVGDPFQIEPVVTIPEQLVNNISHHFGLDKTQIQTSLSVQSMADRANPYGWITNDTWTGCFP